jgi:hypothetical protein
MELIPIDKELSDFKSHLEINERTIFSAKFGDGKTFFLNEFKKLYKDDYYFITLYPINYSIADNQDIFEYIKRDILFQLAKDGKLNPIDFEGITNSIFTLESLKEVISFLISCLPKGEILNKILEKGKTFAKKYKEEQTTFKKYESWFTSQKGGLYEHDGYTELIIETLKYIKSSGYKTVLIIEDLDRIDPAHLFRILNVLGAHIDEHLYEKSNYSNKFDFDNIITIFDNSTTENIFYHCYGKNANYNGYINKFISHQPFYYSINKVAQEYLYKIISNKCCLSKEDFNNMSNELEKKISSLSIRTIKSIISGMDSYIIERDYIGNDYLGTKFNTKSPLTYTIALFKMIGINDIITIKEYLFKLPELSLLNCVNVFLMIYYLTPSNSFKYNSKSYSIKDLNYYQTHNQSFWYNDKSPSIDKISIIENINRKGEIESLDKQHINKCINLAFENVRK